MRERIKAPPAEEVVEYLFKPRALTSPGRDFRILLRINRAHIVMLVRQSLLAPEHGRALLQTLSELESAGVEACLSTLPWKTPTSTWSTRLSSGWAPTSEADFTPAAAATTSTPP